MARRIKSFSPYTYSPVYRPAGRLASEAPGRMKTAMLEEEQLVISKPVPNWLVYVIDNEYYLSNEDCSLDFEKAFVTFSIVGKDSNYDVTMSLEPAKIEPKSNSIVIDLKLFSNNVHWASSTEVTIEHQIEQDAWCVVIADSEFIQFSAKNSPNSLNIKFMADFNISDFSKIDLIVFPIGIDFKIAEIGKDDIFYSELDDAVYFSNEFNSSNVFPILLDDAGFSFPQRSIDISAGRVFMKNRKDLVLLRRNLEEELATLNEEDEDRREEIECLLNEMHDEDRMINAKSGKLCVYPSNCFITDLQYGINRNNVVWLDEKTAKIDHMLNSKVFPVIDMNLDLDNDVKIFEESSDSLKIVFEKPIQTVCSIRIFPIG